MRRFFRMFAATFAVSTSTMLIYRANVFFFVCFEIFFLAAQFLSVKLGFDLAGGNVAGWTREQAYVLTAVNGLSHQLFICFFINPIFNLAGQVWNGQFDYLLMKPLPPLLAMFFHGQYAISNLPTLIVNAVAVVLLLVAGTGGGPLTAEKMLVFSVFFLVGVMVRVSLAVLCMAPVFFSERLADVEEGFWSLASLGKYPLATYPRGLALFLTFVLPIGMLGAFPAETLFHETAPLRLLLALGASLLFCVVAVLGFKVALTRYQSVNSGV